jgi:hypothetical protein
VAICLILELRTSVGADIRAGHSRPRQGPASAVRYRFTRATLGDALVPARWPVIWLSDDHADRPEASRLRGEVLAPAWTASRHAPGGRNVYRAGPGPPGCGLSRGASNRVGLASPQRGAREPLEEQARP